MIAIENVLISDEVLESRFICALDQCKGACCYEGDFGAPINDAEKEILDRIYPEIREFLPEENRKAIEQQGTSAYYREMRSWGTSLMPDGACVFMTRDDKGIAACGIEQAWKQGATDFQKPISCHLYPIRIKENKSQGFVAVNYDRWEICNPGCRLGASEKMPLFRFLKSALVRRFGAEFYDQLEAAYEQFHSNQSESTNAF